MAKICVYDSCFRERRGYPLCHRCVKNFHSWWKFDKVLTVIILHAFLDQGSANNFFRVKGRMSSQGGRTGKFYVNNLITVD